MRPVLMLTAVLLLPIAGVQAQTAPSSTPPAAPPTTQGMAPSAPVGHRQPKISDLPPDIAIRQKNDAQSVDDRLVKDADLDRRLKICRGC
jgi:hypothetical protein